MKYAVFTVSTPDYTPEEAVRRIKDAGYNGIEWRVQDDPPSQDNPTFWSGNRATLPLTGFERDAPRWRALTSNAGLETPAIATYVKCNEPNKAELAMKGASALGTPALRIQVPHYDGTESFTKLWDASVQEYKIIADLAARHGVNALVEIHHRSIVPSASAARRFLDDLDPAHVGAIHDAGNMVHEGWEHPRLAFETLGPYLAHVHMKNTRWEPGEMQDDGTVAWTASWAPVPEGIADVRSIMRALRHVGYNTWITFEDFSTERPLEHNLERNLAYIKAIELEIAAES
jgi:sugar phosphate isomerase/epimerase